MIFSFNHNEPFNFLEGAVLLFDKPYQWTSFDVVNKVRYLIRNTYQLKKLKLGHAGTLDPLATGLLVLCAGKFTKRIAEFQELEKEYTGTITIGAQTPSGDLETEVGQHTDINHITETNVMQAAEKFVGTIAQTPPVYSAKKIGGVRAYEFARKGEEIAMKKNIVQIKSFVVSEIAGAEISFKVTCSKGTYIRSLAMDFGQQLGVGAYLSELRRTRIGELHVKDAIEIDAFEQKIKSCIS